MRCDLHLHTTLSDGKATPEALVFKASARNLDVIAVTDHDTTDAVEAAQAEGEWLGVRVIPGVEISATVAVGDRKVGIHLISLGIDIRDEALQAMLLGIRESRQKATRETIERLTAAGYPVPPPEARGSMCRPHLADALVRAGHARSRQNAFEKFLGGEAYKSDYVLPTAEEAIRAVHRSGGVCVYAHPMIEEIDAVAPLLKDCGVDGIEVWRASFQTSPRGLYALELARHLGIMPSGGSDWHGLGGVLGEFFVTDEQIRPLVREIT